MLRGPLLLPSSGPLLTLFSLPMFFARAPLISPQDSVQQHFPKEVFLNCCPISLSPYSGLSASSPSSIRLWAYVSTTPRLTSL